MSKKQILITTIMKMSIHILYQIFGLLFRVNNKKVTFASYRSKGLQGNLKSIYEELSKRDDDFEIILLFKKYDSKLHGKIDYYLHMVKATFHLATSRYFIIDDYYLPVYFIKPRRGSDIIQLWHAAGAFKKFGYSTVGKTFGPSPTYLKHVNIHSNYTKVFVSSSEVIPHYAEAFNMSPHLIKPLGIPRTDYYFRADEHRTVKKRFLEMYPELKEKKLILYAPTFRGKSHYQDSFVCPIDFQALKEIIGENYAVLVNLHPYIKNGLEINENLRGFVFEPKDTFSIHELMAISDLLITDYSSVVFEYCLLNKPICFFANDLEEYKQERDFYYEYLTFIPGPFFSDTVGLGNWIKREPFNWLAIEVFRNRFFEFQDGKASERIVDEILRKVN